ncbi:type II secretion system protein GspG [Candidatus Nomurabacteria bacterium]|nr:type II secretion system protein GspG [Candidatus Nomurabacteria bacterium]
MFALLVGFLPGSTSAVTCPVEINHAYKSPESSSVYFVSADCSKRAFRNARIYFSYFTSWGEVRTTTATKLKSIPNNKLGFLPWGPKRQLENGSLIKTTDDGKVYLYVNGQLRPISDATVFEKQGFKWEWIEDVDAEVIKKHQKGTAVQDDNELPTSAVFKYSDGPEIYVIEDQNGQKVKRHIQDIEELKRLYRLDRVLEVSRTMSFPEKTGSEPSGLGYDTAPKQSGSLAKDARRVADIKNVQAKLELYKTDKGYYPIANGEFNGFLMGMLCSGGFSAKCDGNEITYMNSLPSDPDGKAYTYKGFDGKTYSLTFYIDSAVGDLLAGTIEATPQGMKSISKTFSTPAAPSPLPIPYPTTGTSESLSVWDTIPESKCTGSDVTKPLGGDMIVELCLDNAFQQQGGNMRLEYVGFNSIGQKIQLRIRGVDQYDWNGEYIDMDPGDEIEVTTAASFGDSFSATITYKGGGDYDNPAIFLIQSQRL